VGSGLYERIDEQRWSDLDMEVHEHPIVEGSVGQIKSAIEHCDHRDLSEWMARHCRYAMWEARRTILLPHEGGLDGKVLTARQRFKYRNLDSWWFPWLYFFHTYVMKFGFLDGSAGFHYAFYKAWYFLTVRLMIRELRKNADARA
jgi:hypothetical protein